ncbi:hypothetical protein EPZ47_03370 [Pseudomonas viciae]|uniref:Uncharacterized protein n=1 Tax=Pseudomonas viciae TaxID=2505979 RepID=A0A4P7PBL4_9PSED|nr:hypothetical protein EPZ47_03370 [Pseudomonas viciae]
MRTHVGANLLAIAIYLSTSMVKVSPLSRASSLPQGYVFGLRVTSESQPSCLRRNNSSTPVPRWWRSRPPGFSRRRPGP